MKKPVSEADVGVSEAVRPCVFVVFLCAVCSFCGHFQNENDQQNDTARFFL